MLNLKLSIKMFKIHKFDSVDSTNEEGKKFGYNSVIVSSVQVKGKGRFKREWESKKGGLWFSIVLEPTRELFEYTFIASLAVLKGAGVGGIKWPNDVVYEGKKLCGILSESVISGDRAEKMIIGIGMNVNNDDHQHEIILDLKIYIF